MRPAQNIAQPSPWCQIDCLPFNLSTLKIGSCRSGAAIPALRERPATRSLSPIGGSGGCHLERGRPPRFAARRGGRAMAEPHHHSPAMTRPRKLAMDAYALPQLLDVSPFGFKSWPPRSRLGFRR